MVHFLFMGRASNAKARLLAIAWELMGSQSCQAVSVDHICKKAAVNKGSFYYFFPSKSDLVVAACDSYWQRCRPAYDQIFAAAVPPLRRLEEFCRAIYAGQKEKLEQTGMVCGCPIASVGSELSLQDEKIRQKSAEIIQYMCGYF
jgi:TetR/AcrR family transcriptional repressor of nem operon